MDLKEISQNICDKKEKELEEIIADYKPQFQQILRMTFAYNLSTFLSNSQYISQELLSDAKKQLLINFKNGSKQSDFLNNNFYITEEIIVRKKRYRILKGRDNKIHSCYGRSPKYMLSKKTHIKSSL